jgi:peptidoglycan hydrolase-like protein with peptidoglycan-binding domain
MPATGRTSFFPVLQRTHGNRYAQRVVAQAKLEMGQIGDIFEQEADRMADAVMQMPVPVSLCQKEQLLHDRKPPNQGLEVASGLEARINHLRGSGLPLPEPVRAFFEPRFGYDFSMVRIHTDARAAELARALNARAFTVGQDVVFGAGQYAPGTTFGRKLLAHELVHVIQQTGRGIAPSERPRYLQCANSRLMSHRFADDPLLQSVFRGERLIQRGDKGPAVKKIQQALIDAGFSLPRYGADSDFGGETEAAVRSYQSAHGLEANGIIVTTTMENLDTLFSAPPTPTPEISARDVIDERIDVAAQKAILRMRSRSSDRAYELLSFIKNGQLRGFVGDDLRLAAEHAAELGTVRWKLVPKYQDAKVVPGVKRTPPLAVYKAKVRDSQERMDRVADFVHDEADELIGGRLQKPACPCHPPRLYTCSQDQENMVKDAFITAAKWMPDARRKIVDYINHPDAANNKAAATALLKHFKWTEAVRKGTAYPDIPRIVIAVIDKLSKGMSKSPICPDCPPRVPKNDVDAIKVHASSPGSWRETNCYDFYPLFFQKKGTKADDRLRAKIVIHEMVHSWHLGIGLSIETYEGDIGNYPPEPLIAQFNPDSYAGLIRDLRKKP